MMSTTVRSKRARLQRKLPPKGPTALSRSRELRTHQPGEPTTRLPDPQWYKSAVIYELRVRSFFDGNGDGIGDLAGLRARLGYLQDLGINALWLLPFYPSPLKDDGYDISDYTAVHPDVGTLEDFKNFLDDAHQRGIRVITELVLNHTSDQHPWFQRARHSPKGDPFRDFYVWSDDPARPARYADARIIFNDFEDSNWTWDPVAGAWFWHRFFAHQPDLNYDNPAVVEAMLQAIDFWLRMGVDGLRLDAIPYLFEREGTTCESLPETHDIIRRIRAYVDARYFDRMLLAEANQWPEDAAAYFGNGDECQMAFHFPIMPRLFMSLRMEDRFPVVDILEQTPAIPESCQWALFLRNHDELTLEMVTDEERDYMWRTHALDHRARINQGIRRRLAPLLGNSRRRLEVMNSLLFSLPGTPVIYYGDEIGMGDNMYLGDRNGVRTPMQWTSDRNAGFSQANPQALILPVVTDPEYHYQTVNVETQQANPSSLLWWTKRMIALRKQRPVFGSGSMKVLHPGNPRVFAFVRELDGDAVLVVVNFSRFVQYFELDLSEYRGARPRELIGGACFPPVRSKPYPLTLGPHTFYWLSLSSGEPIRNHPTTTATSATLPLPWHKMSSDPGQRWLEEHLEAYLRRQPWAAEVLRDVRRVHIENAFSIPFGDKLAHAIVILVEPTQGLPVRYLVPLALAEGPFADALLARFPNSVVVRVANERDGSAGLVHDAMADREFCSALLGRVDSEDGSSPSLSVQRYSAWFAAAGDRSAEPRFPVYQRDATVVDFGERFTLRLLHRVEAGPQPEEDIHSAAVSCGVNPPVPELAAVLRLGSPPPHQESCTIATVSTYVPNFGSAWQYTLEELARFFDAALGVGALVPVELFGSCGILNADPSIPEELVRCVAGFSGAVETMARRVAEWHLALGSLTDDVAFRPEPYTTLYQRSLYQGIRSAAARALLDLQQFPVHGSLASSADVLACRRELLARLRLLIARRINASRIRIHGDMQLEHLLYTGRDFRVAHCSGDPEKSLSQRALKRSPLRDVATMISSFHRVLTKTLLGELGASVRVEDLHVLRAWARAWLRHVVTTFVRAYTSAAAAGGFLPEPEQSTLLLFAFLLEKHAVAVSRHIVVEPSEAELSMDLIVSLAR